MYNWRPYAPRAARLRIHATSCCGEYELAAEGGEYFVLRWTGGSDKQEETGRGVYAHALEAWSALASQHRCSRRAS
ncbi:hypothetical protein ACQEVF_18065 [Nonomuraea polychroma]|uniref:hypothetical protein n=1 Tax=Nonomuraea polychroma TaxID=46176 RepID=UPI003D920BA2